MIINGTEQKGCTFAMKELFLSSIGSGHSITEYYLPRDCPVFCTGCKVCFYSDISKCPHSHYTIPIWKSILKADLLIFVSPTYVLHVPAQTKSLLDHLGTKFIAHSPEKPMFSKQAVIITNAIGAGMGKTAHDIKDSLDFWGVARTFIIKQGLASVDWELVDSRRKKSIQKQCKKIAAKIKRSIHIKPRLKIKVLFFGMKIAHTMINKAERKAGRESTKDYLYWKEHGWLDGKRPWED